MRCLRCSNEIAPGLDTCPQCGAARPPLPPTFAQAELEFLRLAAAYRAGRIDQAAFRHELGRLSVQDERGVIWALANDGRWHWYSSEGWVQADPPPLVVAPAAVAPRAGAQRQARRPRLARLVLGCGGLVVLALALLALTGVLGYGEYQTTPLLVEGAAPAEGAPPAYPLSAGQQAVVDRLGYPQSFTLLFFQEAGEDVRLETWSYYGAGTEFTFRNGELMSETALDLSVGQLEPLPYRPDSFVAYMSLDQVVAAAGLDRYLIIPVEKAMVDKAQVYLAEQLAFGLQDGELVSVETLALESE
jgi:hypothetical protein